MFFSRRPRIYAVYINPQDPAAYEKAEFVEESWTLYGFMFHVLWCLYHKLWLYAGIVAVRWSALLMLGNALGLSMMTITAIEIFMRLIVAFEGNQWRQTQLKRQGYILSDIVTGDGEIAAKLRFYQRWLDQQPSTLATSIRNG